MRILKNFAAGAKSKESGFTLVELLVVVSIIVALAAVSVVSVGQFAGKGTEGATASEQASVQAAMDAMLADMAISSIIANDLTTTSNGVQDFAAVPTERPLTAYMRQNPTTYFYCWDSTGKVKQLAATAACPAGPY